MSISNLILKKSFIKRTYTNIFLCLFFPSSVPGQNMFLWVMKTFALCQSWLTRGFVKCLEAFLKCGAFRRLPCDLMSGPPLNFNRCLALIMCRCMWGRAIGQRSICIRRRSGTRFMTWRQNTMRTERMHMICGSNWRGSSIILISIIITTTTTVVDVALVRQWRAERREQRLPSDGKRYLHFELSVACCTFHGLVVWNIHGLALLSSWGCFIFIFKHNAC